MGYDSIISSSYYFQQNDGLEIKNRKCTRVQTTTQEAVKLLVLCYQSEFSVKCTAEQEANE